MTFFAISVYFTSFPSKSPLRVSISKQAYGSTEVSCVTQKDLHSAAFNDDFNTPVHCHNAMQVLEHFKIVYMEGSCSVRCIYAM